MLPKDTQTATTIIDREREDPSVITATNQDIPGKTAGRFIANLLIESHQDQQMTDKRANNVTYDNNRDKITILPTKTSPFSKEQLEILQKLFSQNSLSQSSMSASGSRSRLIAQKGKFLTALSVNKRYSSPWIINSEASDHMTGDATILNEYNQCTNNSTVRIVDGSSSQVKGIGMSRLSRDMILNSISMFLIWTTTYSQLAN